MTGRIAAMAAIVTLAIGLTWIVFVGLPRHYGGPTTRASAATPPTAPAAPGRKIKARLYYIGDDGSRLTAVERDVPYGETPVDQARQIVEAQLAPVAEPLVSPIPPGTTLRALFLTDRGEAVVDLSREVAVAHPGGVLDETLTVYSIVDALTTNLPAVTSVQLLVDGKEADTLAGHVDLREPLEKNLEWVQ